MARLVLETRIEAPLDVCFDLARDVGIHCRTADFTGERAVLPGRTTGLLELGDQVTFEGVHLGVRQRLTARVVEMERPLRFADEQEEGIFTRLRHLHEFRSEASGTVMRDTLEWRSPLGILGTIADRLIVKRHLEWFLKRKQARLKALAEASAPDADGPAPDRAFLSFHVPVIGGETGVPGAAAEILRQLGRSLEGHGFAIDSVAGEQEEWTIAATRGAHAFAVFLGILDGEPGRWYIGLEERAPRPRRLLGPGESCVEAQFLLETGAASLPGVTRIRWHADHTTLRES
jgi:ligand-binding SRPBCC domain-containing protein